MTDTAQRLIEQAREKYYANLYKEAEILARQVAELAEFETELYLEAQMLIAGSIWRLGEIDKAVALAEKTAEDSDRCGFLSVKAMTINTLGNIARTQGELDKAAEYYHRAVGINTQANNTFLLAYNLGNIGYIHERRQEYAQAAEYYNRAIILHDENNNHHGVIDVLNLIGRMYMNIDDYSRALEHYNRGISLAEEWGNRQFQAWMLGNAGIVFAKIKDVEKGLNYALKALAINEELGYKPSVANNLLNIGQLHIQMKDYDRSHEYVLKALGHYENLGDIEGIINCKQSLGHISQELGKYEACLEYLNESLKLAKDHAKQQQHTHAVANLGFIYTKADFEGYDLVKAEEYLMEAAALAEKMTNKHVLLHCYSHLQFVCHATDRWQECVRWYDLYVALKDELHGTEVRQYAEQFNNNRQYAEREKQMAAERARAQEKEKILNNILPEEITARLIKGENPIADHFDCVSILFMDIVDFTTLSTIISAQQLVHLLNAIFKSADGVMREFGLEKIKTIGDAYMAVAGAPTVQADHAARAAHAALKLLDVMQNLVVQFPAEYGDRSWIAQIPEIQVRIGVHCGPAAAGVVGENKFLYDLWGDAVNTASRMESHGAAGKIHCSEDFKNALVETHGSASLQMTFIERGEMEIKGKGMMKTYFLEKQ